MAVFLFQCLYLKKNINHMKKVFLLIVMIAIVSCSKENKQESPSDSNLVEQPEGQTEQKPAAQTLATSSTVVSDFLANVHSLETAISNTSITAFKEEASNTATKTMSLTKENVKEAFETARSYKQAIIVTGDHTVVKIVDFNECQDSGSWGACMPKAEGFIKKGALEYQNDYVNYIIGLPTDNQERTIYFFN